MTSTTSSSAPLPMTQIESHPSTPVTIITGFLGAGKTTLILSLLRQLPVSYTLALLKNELGTLPLDSELASAVSVAGVRELLNGCICCNLVGQLGDALVELREGRVSAAGSGRGDEVSQNAEKRQGKRPDRIIIETSGAAFPATLVLELNRLIRASIGASPTSTPAYTLDGVISVIDVENWEGYADTGVTAKMQSKFTDMVVLNKWEGCDERRRDWVQDRVGDLDGGTGTPVVWSVKGSVAAGVILGVDGALARRLEEPAMEHEHKHDHDHMNGETKDSVSHSDIEVLSATLTSSSVSPKQIEHRGIDLGRLNTMLTTAPKDEVYRIKAIIYLPADTMPLNSDDTPAATSSNPSSAETHAGSTKKYILNWAFGRWTWTPLPPLSASPARVEVEEAACRMTIVTARYESAKWKRLIEGEKLLALAGEGEEGLLKFEKIG